MGQLPDNALLKIVLERKLLSLMQAVTLSAQKANQRHVHGNDIRRRLGADGPFLFIALASALLLFACCIFYLWYRRRRSKPLSEPERDSITPDLEAPDLDERF